mgnify:CR=1 FL=1
MKKGFSLIEIIITVSVLVIFSGLSLTLTQNFSQERKLKSEALKLVNVLEIAKKKAGSGDLSGKECLDSFNGYRVIVNNDGYSLWLRCGGNLVRPAVFSYLFPPLGNTSARNISVISGEGNYDFRELNLTSTSNPRTIRIKNSVISKCLEITISPAGTINLSNNFTDC